MAAHHHKIAAEASIARVNARYVTLSYGCDHCIRFHSARNGNLYLAQGRRRLFRARTVSDNDRRASRLYAVYANQALDGSGKHDANKIVIPKQKRYFIHTCGHNHAARPQMNELFRCGRVSPGTHNAEQVSFVKTKARAAAHHFNGWKLIDSSDELGH